MVPCAVSSSEGGFLLPCDILGRSWASDGDGVWLLGNGAISTLALPKSGCPSAEFGTKGLRGHGK